MKTPLGGERRFHFKVLGFVKYSVFLWQQL